MEHRDGDFDSVVRQMLEDRGKNPKGRIDRQKYVDWGHPLNEVRRAAEYVAKKWPDVAKYSNFPESQENIGKQQAMLNSLQNRVQEYEKGRPEREKLEKEIIELKWKIADLDRKYQEVMEKLNRLQGEKLSSRAVNVDEMERETGQMKEEISTVKSEVHEIAKRIGALEQDLNENDSSIGYLKSKFSLLIEAANNAKSNHENEIVRQRSRFWKMFMAETAVLAILGIIIVVSHALNVIAGDMIMIGRSFSATMINDIHLVTRSLKRFPLAALHFIELHLTHFSHSLISFLRPVAVFFLIVILIILLMSGIATKRR